MNADKILRIHQQLKVVENRGWHIQVETNRVRVFPSGEIATKLNLNANASWIAGETVDEALAFIYGVETAVKIETI